MRLFFLWLLALDCTAQSLPLGGIPVSSGGAGYLHQRIITLGNSGQIPGSETNFVVLVCGNGTAPCNASFSGLNQIGAGAKVQNVNGYDLVFSSTVCSAPTLMAWEMPRYVALTGEFIAWVLTPTLSAGGTFYMCYDNAAISTFQGGASSAVWTAYTMVQHLEEATNAQALDSAGSNNSTINSATQIPGKIGYGQQFVSALTNSIQIPAITAISGVNKAVLCAWIQRAASSKDVGVGPDVTGGTFRFNIAAFSDSKIYETANAAFGAYGNNVTTWNMACLLYDATQSTTALKLQFYYNGVSETISTSGSVPATILATNEPFYIGRAPSTGNYSDGNLDEVTLITGSTVDANWPQALYNNQNAPNTFLTIGAET